MSFQTLNKDVLQQVADEFGVAWSHDNPTKSQMLKDFEEEGVTWDLYKKAFPDPTDEDEAEEEAYAQPVEEVDVEAVKAAAVKAQQKPAMVLVKMERTNPTYEVRGYRFTQSHPYLVVKSDDADFLVQSKTGFRMATPSEVEQYYS